jgi:hypothetical protein
MLLHVALVKADVSEEVLSSYEVSVLAGAARRGIPGDGILQVLR